jgi:hypothetical protein
VITDDDSDFRKNWLNRIRLAAVVKPKTAQTANFVLSLGIEMLMDRINPYLMRADDQAADQFLSMMSRILDLGVNNEMFCAAFLGVSKGDKVSDEDNAKLEAMVGDAMYSEMINAMNAVARVGKDSKPWLPSDTVAEELMVELITMMMDRHGSESVQALIRFEDPTAPPAQRCKVMSQMFTSMQSMPLEKRANLSRWLFGKAGNKQ